MWLLAGDAGLGEKNPGGSARPQATDSWECLVTVERESFEETLTQAVLLAGLQAEVSQGVSNLLDELRNGSPRRGRVGSLSWLNPGCADPEGLGSGSSPRPRTFPWHPGSHHTGIRAVSVQQR